MNISLSMFMHGLHDDIVARLTPYQSFRIVSMPSEFVFTAIDANAQSQSFFVSGLSCDSGFFAMAFAIDTVRRD
ncbi:MAG: hypothetical protein ISN29_02030 [Gammaproteobacteria bacterium AqS3]|nr:hypothetical protein [Gammaproteobacteria bacterium AqS3]